MVADKPAKRYSYFYRQKSDFNQLRYRFMKRILGLAIASLIAFPSTTLAADWVLVSESSDGTRIFVDNESYEKRGAIA